MAANTASPARPNASRRIASIPTAAAYRARMIRMPVSSAVLSLAPKVAMAKSLTRAGVRSMAAWPTASTGELGGTPRPDANWAAPTAIAAASTPASAPATTRTGRAWSWAGPGGAVMATGQVGDLLTVTPDTVRTPCWDWDDTPI